MKTHESNILTLKQVINSINESHNFVGIAITPWQALGIDASIEYLKSKGIYLNGISLIIPHPVTGFACNVSHFTNNASLKYNAELNGIGYNPIKDKILFYKFVCNKHNRQEKEVFYIISTITNTGIASLIQSKFPEKRIKFIIVDEGVATYMNTLKPSRPLVHSLKSLIAFLKYIHCQKIGIDYVKKNHDVQYNQLLLKDKNQELIPNQEIIPFYNKAFENQLKHFKIEVNGEFSNAIIICTTAWERSKILDNEDLKALIRVTSFLNKSGFTLFLKPHPRDLFFTKKAAELNAIIITESISMETICAKVKPQAIVSFSSTVLVTAKLFWNIPTFCCSDMLNRKNIDPFYLNEIDSFKRTFSDFVFFIQQENEIMSKTK